MELVTFNRELLEKNLDAIIICGDGKRRKRIGFSLPDVCDNHEGVVMQYHARAHLLADHTKPKISVYNGIENDHAARLESFLKESAAAPIKPSLVLTPEYSVSLDVMSWFIGKLQREDPRYNEGALYILCSEGVSHDFFCGFIDKLQNDRTLCYIGKKLYPPQKDRGLLNFLLYVTKIKISCEGGREEFKLVVAPQLKTTPMRSAHHDTLEEISLYRGDEVIVFEGDKQFLSLICADAFNEELLSKIADCSRGKRLLICNLQLNMKPRHGRFRYMHTHLIEAINHETRIIALNWAEGSAIMSNRSGAVKLEHLLDTGKNTLETLFSYGIEFTRSDTLSFWMFHPRTREAAYRLNGDSSAPVGEVLYSKIYDVKSNQILENKCGNTLFHQFYNEFYFTDTRDNSRHNYLEEVFRCHNGERPLECRMCRRLDMDKLIFSILLFARKIDERNLIVYEQMPVKEQYALNYEEIERVTAGTYPNRSSRANVYAFRRVVNWLKYQQKSRAKGMPFYFRHGADNNVKLHRVADRGEALLNGREENPGDSAGNDISDEFRVCHIRDANEAAAEKVYRRIRANSAGVDPKIIVLYEDGGTSPMNTHTSGIRHYPANIEQAYTHKYHMCTSVSNSLGISMDNPGEVLA